MYESASQIEKAVSQMEAAAASALDLARVGGAGEARVEVSQVEVKTAKVRNRLPSERSVRLASELTLTVYRNGKRATTKTSDLSEDGLQRATAAALEISSVTAPDPAGGLADAGSWASEQVDLEMFFPSTISLDDLEHLARRAEEAAFAESFSIQASNGASAQAFAGISLLATSAGFRDSFPWSSYTASCAPVASGERGMQAGFWSGAARSFDDLEAPEHIGATAAKRAAGLLDARPIQTQSSAVLFEPSAAMGLLGDFVACASGDALYRTGSFLKDRLGSTLFPVHFSIAEDPFLKRGMASRSFDSDGIAGSRRFIVKGGKLEGYFLGLYAARRLGMQPTGNGSGPHNLEIRSHLTRPTDNLEAMLLKLGRGLFVTETAGGGVNRLSGDFSRAVKGYWIEGGQIQHPVSGITLASNLVSMFGGVTAVGADVLVRGGIRTGSWLIDEMKIGGT